MVEPLKSDIQPFAGDDASAAILARLERPAILVLDQDASIRFWNRGAEVLYGWPAEEALGRRLTWLMSQGSDDSALLRAELAAVRMTGSGERTERRRRGDGSTVSVTVRKVAEATGAVWEISETAEAAATTPKSSFDGVAELIGAEILVFDAGGTLKECSPLEARVRHLETEI